MAEQYAFPAGTICWHEINTPNAEQAKQFYGQMFGWKITPIEMGNFTYHMLNQGGKDFGGIMEMKGPEWQGVPPHWMMYIAVDDVDAAAKHVAELGGKVCVPPTDISVGRFAVVNDPFGAVFSLFKGK